MKIELEPADICRVLGSLEMRLEQNRRIVEKNRDMADFYRHDNADILNIIRLINLQTGIKF